MNDSDAASLIFLQQKWTIVVTMATVTLNPHLSLRFTSTVVVPNLIWSSLEFFTVLYVWWRQQAMYNAVSV